MSSLLEDMADPTCMELFFFLIIIHCIDFNCSHLHSEIACSSSLFVLK